MAQLSADTASLPPRAGGECADSSPSSTERLGQLEVSHLRAETNLAAVLDRAAGDKAASYGFVLVREGALRTQHYGHEATVTAGDFVLLNGAEPFGLCLDEAANAIVVRVSGPALRLYLPSPEQFCGRPLRSGAGISDDVAQLLCSVLERVDTLSDDFRSRIGRNLLDTLATAFSIGLAEVVNGSPIVCSRNARVRLYIERNLRDPELRPTVIASRMRMSSRYLRLIFAAGEETISAYILRRRLEECARELADPQLARQSITQIAFGWGFNSGPHFTRSFRNRFGMSPRDYRRNAATP